MKFSGPVVAARSGLAREQEKALLDRVRASVLPGGSLAQADGRPADQARANAHRVVVAAAMPSATLAQAKQRGPKPQEATQVSRAAVVAALERAVAVAAGAAVPGQVAVVAEVVAVVVVDEAAVADGPTSR